jgi:hypothetical protein
VKKSGRAGRAIPVVALIMMMVMVASCTYRFAGKDAPPFGIRRISVLMFENRTSEIGVESIFTNHLIDELTKDGRMSVVPPGRAGGVFRGTVTNLSIDTVSRRNGYVPLERRVTVTLNIVFEDNDGGVLWSKKNMTRSETYGVSPDKRETELNRLVAISKISADTARDIYQILTWERGKNPVDPG